MSAQGIPIGNVALQIILSVGIIIIAAKYLGTLAKKLGIPQVAGEIVAGLLLRYLPFFRHFGDAEPNIIYNETNQFIAYMAEIGVILIMFSAGLGTNLKSIVKSGVKSTIIAASGVLVPLAMGTVMALCFWGFDGIGTQTFYQALFIGAILTATSVSITVAALKELGKINSEVGQTIISSAIIDDVFGIIVLTVVLGASSGTGSYTGLIVRTLAFFLAAGIAGFIIYHIFKWYDNRHPHSHRIPIYGLGVALLFAYCTDRFFGIADITGAYIAGVVFCNLDDAAYIDQKVEVNSYMVFSPLFFASIGLKTNLSGLTMDLLWFSIAFVAVGCLAKIIGCGGMSLCIGYNRKEALQIGLGMMVRGEVALIVAQKGLAAGMVKAEYFAPVILLIIVSSMIVPILLGKAFAEKKPPQCEVLV